MGGNPGIVVMGGDSCSKIVGSNPGTVNWMDFFTKFFVKLVMFVLKDENKRKRATS